MDRIQSTPESGCCRMARRSSVEITKTAGRPQNRNPLKHSFISGGVVHHELSRRKCLYWLCTKNPGRSSLRLRAIALALRGPPPTASRFPTIEALYERSRCIPVQLLRLARRRLADSFGKFFLFRRNAEGFRNFYPRLQFNNARLGLPGFRVGLGIIDREVELNRCVIDAAVTLDRPHLLTVWLAL